MRWVGPARRYVASLGIASAVAGFVVSPAPAAGPTCLGERATIVVAAAGKITNGTGGADVIVGTTGRDRIKGRGGDDVICGRGGVDKIFGEGGDDSLDGGGGDDHRLSGGQVNGGPGADRVTGGSGNDTVNGEKPGWAGEVPFGKADHLFGGEGDDELKGFGGNDVIDGGPGHDDLDGGYDDDHLIGGIGSDVLLGDTGSSTVETASGIEETGADRLEGGDDNDALRGGDGSDILDGGLGHDSLDGGPGNDEEFGGEGDDIWTRDDRDDDVIDMGPGADQTTNMVGKDLIRGGPGDDYIRTRNLAPDEVYADDGNDRIDVRGFADGGAGDDLFESASTAVGGPGSDTIYARFVDYRTEPGSITLTPGDGEFQGIVETTTGTDLLFAPDGVYGSNLDDSIEAWSWFGVLWFDGAGGNDEIRGQTDSSSSYDLRGGDGNDRLFGFDFDDTLSGGAGDDYIDGGENEFDEDHDVADGGEGTDTCVAVEEPTNCEG